MLIFMGPDDLHLKSLMVAHIERHTHEKIVSFLFRSIQMESKALEALFPITNKRIRF